METTKSRISRAFQALRDQGDYFTDEQLAAKAECTIDELYFSGLMPEINDWRDDCLEAAIQRSQRTFGGVEERFKQSHRRLDNIREQLGKVGR